MEPTLIANLNERQIELLTALVEVQQSVPDGKHIDFLTVSTFGGTSIILPLGGIGR